MKINFTETQKANIWNKLKQSAEIESISISDRVYFKLSNGAGVKSRKLTEEQLTFLQRQVGFEKEFIDTIYNIFMAL